MDEVDRPVSEFGVGVVKGLDAVRYLAFHTIAENDPMKLRDWGIDNWVGLTRLIIKNRSTHIFLLGSEKDCAWYDLYLDSLTNEERNWVIVISGWTQIQDLPYVLTELVSALVCINSSLMHIAVASGCPTLAIVGGTPAHVILPKSVKVRAIEDPALEWYNPYADIPLRFTRLKEISPETVYAELEKLLEAQELLK